MVGLFVFCVDLVRRIRANRRFAVKAKQIARGPEGLDVRGSISRIGHVVRNVLIPGVRVTRVAPGVVRVSGRYLVCASHEILSDHSESLMRWSFLMDEETGKRFSEFESNFRQGGGDNWVLWPVRAQKTQGGWKCWSDQAEFRETFPSRNVSESELREFLQGIFAFREARIAKHGCLM